MTTSELNTGNEKKQPINELESQNFLTQDNLEESDTHLAAAASPAELLTSELLKTEPNTPIETMVSHTPALSSSITAQPDTIQTVIYECVQPSTPHITTHATPVSLEGNTVSQETITSSTSSCFEKIKVIITNPSVLMLLSAFLFASMILFVKLASEHYTSFEIISARGLIGALCILVFQQAKLGFKQGIQSLKTDHLPMQAWRAFIGTMSMMCWFYGVSKLSLALSTTLSYMSSVWIAVFIISSDLIKGKARPNPILVFSILLGFGGIVVIRPPTEASIDMFAASIVLMSSIFAALAYLQVAALGRIGEPAYRTVFYFCAFGVVFGFICTLLTQGYLSNFSLIGAFWLLLIGILAMVAQFCLTLAYTGGNALVNASLQYCGLIFVIIFDWLLGLGWPEYFAWVGMLMIVISGLIATFIRAKK